MGPNLLECFDSLSVETIYKCYSSESNQKILYSLYIFKDKSFVVTTNDVLSPYNHKYKGRYDWFSWWHICDVNWRKQQAEKFLKLLVK